jgi:glycyl-tRNA synthetase beta chain
VRPALQQLAENLERGLAEVFNEPPGSLGSQGPGGDARTKWATDAGGSTPKEAEPPVVTTLGTHRRLTAFIADLPSTQPAHEQVVVGPPVGVAFGPRGEPTQAALGFARAQGVRLEDLEVRDTPRGRYLSLRKHTPGRPTADLLCDLLPAAVGSISFPKSMYWRSPAFRFARPVRYLLVLLDEDVLPVEIAGLRAGRTTRGHPFLAPGEISLARADLTLYLEQLAGAYVVADDRRRQEELRHALTEAARRHGGEFREEELLEEVTFLVELVNVVEGRFPAEYLQLPREVLEAAMKSHQRYFPVHDASGNLVDRFLIASNRPREADDTVRAGNERVLVARLFDARFFWQEDRRRPLGDRVADLEQLIFQEQLGSYREKCSRLATLAPALVEGVGLPPELKETVARAALLAKADLTTEMVTEFPELQGIMGREYARADSEPEPVSLALGEQYLPRRADDPVPTTAAGAILALADRLDTLAGCFAVGLVPSGSADPYGLRRAALGALRILMEKGCRLSLKGALATSLAPFADRATRATDQVLSNLLDFFRDRLTNLLLEEGYALELVRAVLATGCDDPVDVVERLKALRALAAEPGWRDLVKAVERTANITRDCTGSLEVSESHLREPEEKRLFALYQEVAPTVRDLVSAGNYLEGARTFARTFAQPLHVFFERVFVNVEEEALRRNRLALLKEINLLISATFADLSQVHVE